MQKLHKSYIAQPKYFRIITHLVIHSNNLSYVIGSKDFIVIIPFHDMKQYIRTHKETLANIENHIYNLDDFFESMEDNANFDTGISDLIMSEYHSIMSRGGYISQYIHLDDIRITFNGQYFLPYNLKYDLYTRLESLAKTYYEQWNTVFDEFLSS